MSNPIRVTIVLIILIISFAMYFLGYMRGYEFVMKQQASFALSQSRLYEHVANIISCGEVEKSEDLLRQLSEFSATHAKESLNDSKRIS